MYHVNKYTQVDLSIYNPICLPPLSVNNIRGSYMGRMITITGWGGTDPDYSGDYPDELQEMDDGNVPISNCPSSPFSGYDDIFCAGRAGSNIGMCKGDSGGPVTINVNISQYTYQVKSFNPKILFTRLEAADINLLEWLTLSVRSPRPTIAKDHIMVTLM